MQVVVKNGIRKNFPLPQLSLPDVPLSSAITDSKALSVAKSLTTKRPESYFTLTI